MTNSNALRMGNSAGRFPKKSSCALPTQKPDELLDGGEVDGPDFLPEGIYNLKPHMYPKGYLTYKRKRMVVTGRGKNPEKRKTRWTLSNPVNGRQLMSTLVQKVEKPYLKIEDDELLTGSSCEPFPSSYYFRVQDTRGEEVKQYQSDPDSSQYIGVDNKGNIVRPSEAGTNMEYAQFTTTEVAGFRPSSTDFDQDIVQILPTSEMNKAISIGSKGHVFLSPKDKETTHVKAISSGQGNVLYTFQGVKHPSLNLKIRVKDGYMIAHKKPTSFAILKATVPGKDEDDVYVIYSPDHREFVCVKEDHLELDRNPLPPSGSEESLTKGPGFFHIEILSK